MPKGHIYAVVSGPSKLFFATHHDNSRWWPRIYWATYFLKTRSRKWENMPNELSRNFETSKKPALQSPITDLRHLREASTVHLILAPTGGLPPQWFWCMSSTAGGVAIYGSVIHDFKIVLVISPPYSISSSTSSTRGWSLKLLVGIGWSMWYTTLRLQVYPILLLTGLQDTRMTSTDSSIHLLVAIVVSCSWSQRLQFRTITP
jgi:hypothetical protein